ncbi:hypothetical protein C9F11_21270 [Streptomyces sp. YIM 121038]|uniref:hypothetical protein n=1 Tax=Streptomyces sp. YIM 121038 TaxID=2136401 RepID=UPI001110C354|nr:hypothetical protein [Streptomyces sp. YIM 121038]QCX77886.1 hypothetical protein C9F11_21270 [Streptomyces sp. YIM 121038]
MRRRIGSLITAGVVTASCALLSGTTPVQAAAVPCTGKEENLKVLAGSNANRVDVKLCGWRTADEDTVQGFSEVDWLIEDPEIVFSKFKIQTRIEKRATADGRDIVVDSATCDFAKALNSAAKPRYPEQCHPAAVVDYDANYWWSTDATVTYDVEGDGKGEIAWELNGSPLVHTPPLVHIR